MKQPIDEILTSLKRIEALLELIAGSTMRAVVPILTPEEAETWKAMLDRATRKD